MAASSSSQTLFSDPRKDRVIKQILKSEITRFKNKKQKMSLFTNVQVLACPARAAGLVFDPRLAFAATDYESPK